MPIDIEFLKCFQYLLAASLINGLDMFLLHIHFNLRVTFSFFELIS